MQQISTKKDTRQAMNGVGQVHQLGIVLEV